MRGRIRIHAGFPLARSMHHDWPFRPIHPSAGESLPVKASVKAGLLALSFVPAFAVTSAAIFGSAVRVYVYTALEETDTFHVVPQTLTESVQDLQGAIDGGITNGLAVTTTRERALVVVRVTSREKVQGEYRVHAHVTIDGHVADFTGTSTHQWRHSAEDLTHQLSEWAKTQRGDLKAATGTR